MGGNRVGRYHLGHAGTLKARKGAVEASRVRIEGFSRINAPILRRSNAVTTPRRRVSRGQANGGLNKSGNLSADHPMLSVSQRGNMETSSVSGSGRNGYSAFDPDSDLDSETSDVPVRDRRAEEDRPSNGFTDARFFEKPDAFSIADDVWFLHPWVESSIAAGDSRSEARKVLDSHVPTKKGDATDQPLLLADAIDVLPIVATASDMLPPPARYATFTVGPIVAPKIQHDHGFLGKDPDRREFDASKRRTPTLDDQVARAAWISKLRGAQLVRPDLKDACTAYEHYLFGKGVPLVIDYERFVVADSSGATVLQSALEDARVGAVEFHNLAMKSTPPGARIDTFTMASDALVVGDSEGRYPYPETENWQKTIGGNAIWLESAVTVRVDPANNRRDFEIDLLVHAEDMYNFDPHKVDIATGAPDEANGRFQECGLGDEFLSVGTATRQIKFSLPLTASDSGAVPADLVVTGGPHVTPAPAPAIAPPPPHVPQ
jgi:hypothetical protein